MVYQDPGRALNPSLRIGRQMAEIFAPARRCGRGERADRAVEMLQPRADRRSAERVMERYPHQLSGGMQQRVVDRHGAGHRTRNC